MIVRKYTRRSRCTAAGDDDPFSSSQDTPFSSSQDTPFSSQDDPFALPFSSQDSSQWSLDLDPTPSLSIDPVPAPLPPRRGRRGVKRDGGGEERGRAVTATATATATLMEAQEFGEMMEHMDEVNFALDGLRPAQPARIRRASLLSLLGICGTAQQRRLLRAQGMARRIIDAILDLTFDDSPSTVAAAALFFVLASDLQDDHLLDSPSCIRFLLKLLNPPSDPSEKKTPGIGSKLLQMRTRHILNGADKRIDSSSKAIISKVHEILLNCKEMRSAGAEDEETERPELSSKWISLLTMEKACLSTVSFEDTTDAVRKAKGTFKERLRELGGLDAVFHVIASCHSAIEGWFRKKSPSVPELKDGVALKNLVLILKCLKIMENATFLSKDNQFHLLGMEGQLDSGGSPLSFVGVVLSAIKCFSDISLHRSSTTISNSRKSNCASESVRTNSYTAPEVEMKETLRGNKNGTSSCANTGRCGIEMDRRMNNLKISHKRQKLSASQSKVSVSGSETITSCGVAKNCSASVSCNGALSGSNGERCANVNGLKLNKSANGSKLNFVGASNGRVPVKANASKMNSPISEDVKSECGRDSFDPFAFDEDELEPTKWELAMKKEPSEESQQTHQNDIILREPDGCDQPIATVDQDSSQLIDEEFHLSSASSCRSIVEEDSNLLDDCLRTAIKVLMNLTNDNPVGCQQIAACGVMDTMASLIISHFPLQVKLVSVPDSKTTVDNGHLNHRHLRDHELDFLVAILGLLVNLVEKNSQNRLRLASAHIPVVRPGKSKSKGNPRDIITLLCSMFLANQGAGEAAEEGRLIVCDEASLLQGEREAEKMIVEAYVALLLAFLSTESGKVREDIARCLPNHNLEVLVPVLERFVAFHMSLKMISPDTQSTVLEVIESCKGS